jgi:hypothetical protein
LAVIGRERRSPGPAAPAGGQAPWALISSNGTLVSAWLFLDTGEIIEDQRVVLVEPLDRGREPEFLPCRLQLLDEVGGAREQHAVAGVDRRVAEGCGEMRLADAGRSEQQDVGALSDPALRPFGDPMLQQRRRRAGGRPAVAIGGLADRRPEPGDGGQAELVGMTGRRAVSLVMVPVMPRPRQRCAPAGGRRRRPVAGLPRPPAPPPSPA